MANGDAMDMLNKVSFSSSDLRVQDEAMREDLPAHHSESVLSQVLRKESIEPIEKEINFIGEGPQ